LHLAPCRRLAQGARPVALVVAMAKPSCCWLHCNHARPPPSGKRRQATVLISTTARRSPNRGRRRRRLFDSPPNARRNRGPIVGRHIAVEPGLVTFMTSAGDDAAGKQLVCHWKIRRYRRRSAPGRAAAVGWRLKKGRAGSYQRVAGVERGLGAVTNSVASRTPWPNGVGSEIR
jgi:hypothetical protein